MTYRVLSGTAAPQAFIFYWSKHQSIEEYRVGWMILCFPLNVVYIRPLRPDECQQENPPGSDAFRYGAFNQFSASCLMVATSVDQLCMLAYFKNYVPVLAQ